MAVYTEIVSLPIEEVWKHLLHKIEHPEFFVPGVSDVVILEKTTAFTLRSMKLLGENGQAMTVFEKITAQPYLVRFTLVDHPVYKGYVDNLAEKVSARETRLTFAMHWTNLNTGENLENPELLKRAVQKTIEYMRQTKR